MTTLRSASTDSTSKNPTKAPRRPRKTLSERDLLLSRLRAESAELVAEFERTGEKPICRTGLLADLARSAAHCHRKSFVWRGIRFPLLCGFALQILDPTTRKPLVATGGGFVC